MLVSGITCFLHIYVLYAASGCCIDSTRKLTDFARPSRTWATTPNRFGAK